MGLKSNFNAFLSRYYKGATTHLSAFKGKWVAVDTSLYLHKYKHSYGTQWLNAFVRLVQSFRRNGVHCVFVMDGSPPVEKEAERAKRQRTRDKTKQEIADYIAWVNLYDDGGPMPPGALEAYKDGRRREQRRANKRFLVDMARSGADESVTESMVAEYLRREIARKQSASVTVDSQDYVLMQRALDIMGVPYCTAPTEAEKMCAWLCRDARVHAVLTEDTDVLAYKAPLSLRNINLANDTCVSMVYNEILEALQLNDQAFLDLCIMCGTDYNPNISRIGAVKSYALLTRHGSIEEIAINENLDTSVLNVARVRELFTEFDTHRYPGDIRDGTQPDILALDMFAKHHHIHVDIEAFQSTLP